MPRQSVLTIGIDSVTEEEALHRIVHWVTSPGGKAKHVVTANPEMIMQARCNKQFADVLRRADMVVADGIGVVWAANFLKRPVPQRIAGIDLTRAALNKAAEMGWNVFLLGAQPGVAEEAARRLQKEISALRIVGVQHGYFAQEEIPRILDTIKNSNAHILLVALGVPKQELWIAQQCRNLPVRVAMGVGGAFDVFAGRIQRAPQWTQRIGMEWAYRLMKQPQRIVRLRVLPQFVWHVIKERWSA